MCILLILYTWTTICSSPWHTSGDTKNEGAGGCLRCLLNPTAAVRNLVQSICCFWSQHRAKLIPANILFLGQLLQFARFKNSARAIDFYVSTNQVLGIKSLRNPYWVWFDSSFWQQPSPPMTLLTMTFYQMMPPQAPRTHLFYSLVCFCWEQITCLVTTWTGT